MTTGPLCLCYNGVVTKKFLSTGLILVSIGIGFSLYFNQKKNEPVFCTQEAKMCPDGSFVGRTGPMCEFAECPPFTGDDSHFDLIRVQSLTAGDLVSSPLTITGEARGNWYFEASFPVQLLDADGNVLVSHYAQAQSEWMTTDFVPFSSVLVFDPPATATGTLVLQKDNPSGESQFDDSISIPIRFAP
jgi:hypothetical protein